MKKKILKKRGIIIGIILVSMLVLVACGSNGAADNTVAAEAYDMGMDSYAESDYGFVEETISEEAVAEDSENRTSSSDSSKAETVSDNRKLIKRTNLSLETLEFDEFINSLETLVEESGGYVEYLDQSNESYYSDYGRYASYTIRIPASKLDTFVDQVGNMASVESKNESVTDITLSYVDLESKKEMYEIEQDNLLELLDRADTIEDMIVIESRLTEIRYQLQSMESQLRTYDNLVDYATITIYVDEVVRLEPEEEAPAGERIRVGFSNSMAEVFERAREFGIRFVIALPVIIYDLLILAIIGGIIFLIVKLILRKNKKKKAKMQEQLEQQRRLQQQWMERQRAQENMNQTSQNTDSTTVE